jgi:hypothetical protein
MRLAPFYKALLITDLIATISAQCYQSCSTCQAQNDPTKCLTCSSNYYLLSAAPSSCICGPQRFYDENGGKCVNCNSTCKTCKAPGGIYNCLSCESGAALQPDGSCKCQSQNQYMAATTGACNPCHFSCLTCVDGTDSGCINCRSSANLVSGKCICTDGYSFDQTTKECTKCHPTCKRCSDTTEISCIECYPAMTSKPLQGIASFMCRCPPGQVMGSPGVCITCGGQCNTCSGTGANQCTSCFTNASLLLDGTCRCNFPRTWNSATKVCESYSGACHVSCLTCFGSGVNNCLTCKQNAILTSVDSCACISGYSFNTGSGACVACVPECKTCMPDQTSKCSSCYDSRPSLFMTTTSMRCYCNYDGGPRSQHYPSALLGCTNCPINCRTCPDSGACFSCNEPKYRESGICKELVLKPCYPNCNMCQGSPIVCTECKSFATWNAITSTCDCDPGFGFINGKCQMCTVQGCGKCSPDTSTCTSCLNNIDYLFGNNICTCKDPTKFLDPADGKCKSCHLSCATCNGFGPKNCLTCPTNSELLSDNSCSLIYYQYWNSGTSSFKPCHITCKTCTGQSSTDCLECRSPLAILSNSRSCLCPYGTFMKLTTGYCDPCHSSCQRCTGPGSNECSQCHNSAKWDSSYRTCTCDGDRTMGPNSICSFCDKTCLTCLDNSTYYLDSCLTCKSNAALENNSPAPNRCVCNDGYYLDNNGNCQSCHVSCRTCFAQGIFGCSSAKTTPGTVFVSNINMIACATGYYMSSGGICAACYPSCKTCTGPASNQCSSCNGENTYFKNGMCTCPTGFIMENRSCTSCGPRCVSCSVPGTCLSCVQFSTLVANACNCKTGYQVTTEGNQMQCVKSNSDGPCSIACDTCSTPNDPNKCTACPTNSYLLTSGTPSACPCSSDYGRFNNTRCKGCAQKCITCSTTNSTQCTSCECSIGSDCDSNCNCNIGKYMNYADKRCYPCHQSCKKCDGPQMNNCLECDNGNSPEHGYCGFTSTSIYYKPDFTTEACESPCLTCAVDKKICRSCVTNNFYLLNGECFCKPPLKFSNNDCISTGSCEATCMPNMCTEGNSEKCIKCNVGGYIESKETCKAIDGYFYKDKTFFQCHQSCYTCDEVTSDKCLTCKRGASSNTASSGVCSCHGGMMMSDDPNKWGDCIYNCNDPACAVCSFSTTCTFCKGELTVQAGKCTCPLGKYKDGSICKWCHQECQTCTGGLNTQCVDCKSNAYLSGGRCYCDTGYFMDGKGVCQLCGSTCSGGCTSGLANGCSACTPDRVLGSAPDTTCRLAKDSIKYCYPTCVTCDGLTRSDCITCKVGMTRTNAGLAKSECKCTDTKKYFSFITENCESCHSACLTCNGPNYTECTSCTPPALLDQTGSCSCPPNTSVGTDIDPYLCTAIIVGDPTCLTYKGTLPTDCLACKSIASKDYSSNCRCPSGHYFDSVYTCMPCDPSCLQCSGPTNKNCLQCKYGFVLDSDGHCRCEEGYQMMADGTCSQIICHYSCLACIDSTASGCKTCKTGSYLSGTSCECLPGFYRDLSLGCLQCSSSCKSCSGVGSDMCLDCNNYATVVQGNCVCMMGYFASGASCLPCSNQCRTCSTSSTTCLSCKQGATLTLGSCIPSVSGLVIDSSGEYSVPGCPYSCATCTAVNQKCLSCKPNAILLPDGTCLCKEGFKLNSATGGCEVINCFVSCKTCIGPGQSDCTSCGKGSSLDTSLTEPKTGACYCSLGYGYDDAGECAPCNLTCSTCSLVSKCILCQPGLIPLQNGLCGCADGFFLNSVYKCQPCDYSCLTCTGSAPYECTSCKNLAQLTLTLDGKECQCIPKHVRIPSGGCSYQTCDTTCLTCFGPNSNQCLTCRPSAMISSLEPRCVCRSNSEITLNGECITCDAICETCNTAAPTVCLSCRSMAFLQPDGKCLCKSGFYFNNSQLQCMPCHYSCKECSGQSDTQCLSCKGPASTISLDSNGKCKCLNGREINAQGLCSTCHWSCLTCDIVGNCASCGSGAILTSYKGCLCSPGFYMNYNVDCKPCDRSCKECIGGTQWDCTECNEYRSFADDKSCKCSTSTYLIPATNTCTKCSKELNCKTCSSDKVCTSCREGDKLKKEIDTVYCKVISTQIQLKYSLQIVHNQAIFYIEKSNDLKTNAEYFGSLAKNETLSIIRLSQEEEVSSCLNWIPITGSIYEWERGVLRFRFSVSESCESFVGLVNLVISKPAPWKTSSSSSSQKRNLQEVYSNNLTPFDNNTKIYKIPTYLYTSMAATKAWKVISLLLSTPIYFAQAYLILIHPWLSTNKGYKFAFWASIHVAIHQFFTLLPFNSVSMHNMLEELTLAQPLPMVVPYFGTLGSNDIANSVYIGKFTGRNISPLILENYGLIIVMLAYLLCLATQISLRQFLKRKSTKRLSSSLKSRLNLLRSVISTMRYSIIASFAVHLTFYSAVNLYWYIICPLKSHPLAIISFIISIGLLIILITESILQKVKIFEKFEQIGGILALEGEKGDLREVVKPGEEKDENAYYGFPDVKDLIDLIKVETDSSEARAIYRIPKGLSRTLGFGWVYLSEFDLLCLSAVVLGTTGTRGGLQVSLLITLQLLLIGNNYFRDHLEWENIGVQSGRLGTAAVGLISVLLLWGLHLLRVEVPVHIMHAISVFYMVIYAAALALNIVGLVSRVVARFQSHSDFPSKEDIDKIEEEDLRNLYEAQRKNSDNSGDLSSRALKPEENMDLKETEVYYANTAFINLKTIVTS